MKRLTLEISEETVDNIFRDILIQDYKNLSEDIRRAESRLEDLKPHEFEDLVDNRRWKEGIAVAMEYYIDYQTHLKILGVTDE